MVLAGMLLAGPATAATMGQCPFGSFAGTGAITQNAQARGDAGGGTGFGWFDLGTSDLSGGSTPYLAAGGDFMTYIETWEQPQTLGTIMVASAVTERSTAGSIYAKTSADGEYEWVCDFDEALGKLGFYDVNLTGVYGVKVEVNQEGIKSNGETDGYYQIGSIGFYADRFVDVASGKATISNLASPGNMTDYDLGNATRYTSNSIGADGDDQWVGVNLGEAALVQGLLIETSVFGDSWAWKNFDVQVYVDVTGDGDCDWVTLGRAAQASNTDLYWVDFGDGVFTSAVRLFGSLDGDSPNHPDGKLISAIMVFTAVPEPATMSLLALGGLALLRRRK